MQTIIAASFATLVATLPLDTVMTAGHGGINSLAVSPDGNYVLTGGSDQSIMLWDVNLGLLARRYSGHTGEVDDAVFAPNGKQFASASWDGTVRIWDYKTGKQLEVLEGHDLATAVAYSPSGKLIAATGSKERLVVWDAKSGKQLHSFTGTHSVSSVRFIDEETILVGGRGVTKWDLKSGKGTDVERTAGKRDPVTFDRKFERYLTTSQKRTIHLRSGTTDIREFTVPVGNISQAHFTPDEKRVVAFVYQDDRGEGSYPAQVEVWNTETGKHERTLRGPGLSSVTAHVAFSPDGQYLYVGTYYMYMWNMRSGELVTRFGREAAWPEIAVATETHLAVAGSGVIDVWSLERLGAPMRLGDDRIDGLERVSTLVFSADGKRILAGYQNGRVILWDARTGKELRSFKGFDKYDWLIGVAFTDNESKIIAAARRTILTFDTKSGRQLTKLEHKKGEHFPSGMKPRSFAISADGKVGATVGGKTGGYVFLWDFAGGRHELLGETAANNWSVDISRDGKLLVAGGVKASGSGGEVTLWDLAKRKKIRTLEPVDPFIRSVRFSPDGKSIVTASDASFVSIYDTKSGKRKKHINAHDGPSDSAVFSPDGKIVYSTGRDSWINVWDPAKGQKRLSFASLNRGDFVVLAPDGHYSASLSAASTVAFRSGLTLYPFEQFDLRRNRPDLVEKLMPKSDPKLVALYKRAYEKRLKRAGLSEEALKGAVELPTIELTNRSKIPSDVTKREVEIKLKGQGKKVGLDRILVWVNDVPLDGRAGRAVAKQAKKASLSIPIVLSQGRNKIQVSVRNTRGVESLRETLNVTYSGPAAKKSLHVVALGVSDYANDEYDLNYAAKDATDIAGFLDKNAKGFATKSVELLKDADVTRERLAAIKAKLQRSDVDDTVVVFAAGHGLLDDELDYFFATAKTEFENPTQTALPYGILEDLLDGIPARKKLMLLDACHSGEVDKDDSELVASAPAQGGSVKSRGFKKKVKKKNATRGLDDAYDIMKGLFADLRRGTGAVVISSAGGAEYAFESPEWNNGVFTYSVLRGLKDRRADASKDGVVAVSELQQHVADEVRALTQGKQNPTARSVNLAYDFAMDAATIPTPEVGRVMITRRDLKASSGESKSSAPQSGSNKSPVDGEWTYKCCNGKRSGTITFELVNGKLNGRIKHDAGGGQSFKGKVFQGKYNFMEGSIKTGRMFSFKLLSPTMMLGEMTEFTTKKKYSVVLTRKR